MTEYQPLAKYSPHFGIVACWFILTVAMGGCGHRAMVETPNPIEIDRVEFTRMYNAAVQVLREYGFSVDRHSHRFGMITTKYLASPTIFEPWKATNSTLDLALESTFNQQQRRVIVSLEPSEMHSDATPPRPTHGLGPARYRLRVEVFIERREHPNRYLTGATTGHGVYGTLVVDPGELAHRDVQDANWRPMGRDPLLEQRLLADIVRSSFNVESAP